MIQALKVVLIVNPQLFANNGVLGEWKLLNKAIR